MKNKNKPYKIKVIRHHYKDSGLSPIELADIEIFYKKELIYKTSNWAGKATSHMVGFIQAMIWFLGTGYQISYYDQIDRDKNED